MVIHAYIHKRLRWEDHEFGASLGNTVRPRLKKTKQTRKKTEQLELKIRIAGMKRRREKKGGEKNGKEERGKEEQE
jgi:hypothetical protein